MAAGDTAGQLAASERLFRLATGPGVLAFQSHFVIRNVGAYTGGVAAASAIMLLGGWPAFAILFVGAGAVRLTAARVTEVTAGAGQPVVQRRDDPRLTVRADCVIAQVLRDWTRWNRCEQPTRRARTRR